MMDYKTTLMHMISICEYIGVYVYITASIIIIE